MGIPNIPILPLCAASVIIATKYGQPYLGQPGNRRVLRGGSWNNNQNNARAAYRNNNFPDNRNNNNGFRVVVVRRPTTYLFLFEGVVSSPFPRLLHSPARPAGCWRRVGRLPYHRQPLPVYASRLRLRGRGKGR
ncbi:MAG: SUMF1/EgtB/PvdO family nonheme iron enzyme [Chloroflexi bacterium]|nr:SUMF1/EgtB/PvdO family nonheme iron enzyme [Chloroflexota bacterium]